MDLYVFQFAEEAFIILLVVSSSNKHLTFGILTIMQ